MSYEGFVQTPIGSNLGSWFHQVSATWTQVGNKYNLYCPVDAGAGDSHTGRYDTPPSTPYTVITRVVPNPTDATGLVLVGGLGITDGTKSMYLNIRYQANSQTSSWSVLYNATATTASANVAGYQYGPGFPWTTLGWMAFRNDGTNIYWYIGDESGQNFYEVYNEAKGAHMTISGVGIFYDRGTNVKAVDVMVESWKVLSV